MNLPGMVFCRHCGKQLHVSAPSCVQCGAPQGKRVPAALPPAEPGLWLPIGGLVSAIIGFLAALNDEVPPPDTATGIVTFAVIGCVFGVVSLRNQVAGKKMAIAAIILSVLAVLALIGSY